MTEKAIHSNFQRSEALNEAGKLVLLSFMSPNRPQDVMKTSDEIGHYLWDLLWTQKSDIGRSTWEKKVGCISIECSKELGSLIINDLREKKLIEAATPPLHYNDGEYYKLTEKEGVSALYKLVAEQLSPGEKTLLSFMREFGIRSANDAFEGAEAVTITDLQKLASRQLSIPANKVKKIILSLEGKDLVDSLVYKIVIKHAQNLDYIHEGSLTPTGVELVVRMSKEKRLEATLHSYSRKLLAIEESVITIPAIPKDCYIRID